MKLGQRGTVEAGAIITGLIALILVYSLASTVVTTSENAALAITQTWDHDDNAATAEVRLYPSANESAQPLFRLGPLFWALVGIGVAASIVIGAMRVKG